MGIATILGYVLQAVQAGFELQAIVDNVRKMQTDGATESDIHMYLRSLAHKNQADLENA